MEETAQQTSAFPAPPYYFKRYTNYNLALLDRARNATPSDLDEDPSIAQDIASLEYPLVALEPPPPITEGHYWQFGKPWPINDRLLTLEEQGCEQLYPKGSIDRVKELKKLNHSALFNFVELVHTLSTSPSQYAEKVEQIRLIFINMHHILNEYRPHQAKETLRLMMQEQLDRKRRETQALRRTCQELRERLAGLRSLGAAALHKPEDGAASSLPPSQEQPQGQQQLATGTPSNSSNNSTKEYQGGLQQQHLPSTSSSQPTTVLATGAEPLAQDSAKASNQWMDIDHI